MATETKKLSPVRKAHQRLKVKYPDCILLFRVNDSYEGYFKDAELCWRICDLPWEHRIKSGDGDIVPMVSFPFWELSKHSQKMLSAGYKVTTCEQVGARDVFRTLTPETAKPPETETMNKLPTVLIESPAFQALRTETARKVYEIFVNKHEASNDGQFGFSYEEAKNRGISKDRFTLALDQLIEVGLIDVQESKRQRPNQFPITLYSLSQRWKYYGYRRFKHRERARRKPGPRD